MNQQDRRVRRYIWVALFLSSLLAILPTQSSAQTGYGKSLKQGAVLAAQQTPILSVVPDTVGCSATVVIQGVGFIPGTQTTLYFGPAGGDNFGSMRGPVVQPDGTFQTEVWVTDFMRECGTVRPDRLAGRQHSVGVMTGSDEDKNNPPGDPSASTVFTLQPMPGDYIAWNWTRTDLPVSTGDVSRTWMWGPEPFTEAMEEPYAESPDGQRTVQYYDKARMEITHPDGDTSSGWYVTNGLLVVELVTGQLQIGDASFTTMSPADVNVAGDADDPNGPTYASFAQILEQAPLGVGEIVIQRINRAGDLSDDPVLANQGITVALVDDVTHHGIATPFWDFMTSEGLVYADGQYVTAALFDNPYFATGRPIAEPAWANVKVAGEQRDVLIQCFERRCLTYTPGNPEGWQVEAGNVGQHYYEWRYGASASSQTIAFSSNRDGSDDIFTVNADGSDVRQLTNSPEEDQLAAWSPDGSRIAFVRGAWDGPVYRRDVYSINADGSGLTKLTDAPAEYPDFDGLAWSPDGTHLAFTGIFGGEQSGIYVMRADGSELRRVTPQDMLAAEHFSWSPNGSRIAFAGSDDDSSYQLYVVNIDGGGLYRLMDGMAWSLMPAWSPDGTQIAFMVVADPSGEVHGIYLTSVDGADTTRLTDTEPTASALLWSPDGTKLAFTALVNGNHQIFVMNHDGSGVTSISTQAEGEFNLYPTWSPDSRRVAFTSFLHGGNQELYVVNADGSGLANLTNHPGWDHRPDWSPDTP